MLAVGTVQPRKNYERLDEVVDQVRASIDVDLIIAGKPAWLAEPVLEAAAARDHVRILGFVDDADLPALYRLASVLAFPSLYEGSGLPPLEAMAWHTGGGLIGLQHPRGGRGTQGCSSIRGHGAVGRRTEHDSHQRRPACRHGCASASAHAATFTWARAARQWLALLEGVR